jgi:aminopeptidase N
MLRHYLGASLFFDAVRYYGNTHAYSTATSYDLLHSFEHVSAQNLGWFFKQWVFGTGYPMDTIIWSPGNSGALITFKQVYNDSATSYFRVPVRVRGTTKSGVSKIVTVWMDATQSSTVFANFGFQPDTIVFDPDGLLLWEIVKSTETSDVVPAGIDSMGLTLGIFSNF